MKKTLNLLFLSLFTLTIGTLGACGYVDKSKKNFTDEDLADKAADSIGIERSEVSVIPGSVQKSPDQISYRVKDTTGGLYRCYFAVLQGVVGYVTSGSGVANCRKIEEGGVLSGNRPK